MSLLWRLLCKGGEIMDNIKLAKFAGFRHPTQEECPIARDVNEWWLYPDGDVLGDLPDFYHDFNACEKWLFPALREVDVNLKTVITIQGSTSVVEIYGSNPFDDDFPTKKLVTIP